jgi:hypothetical protein
VPQTAEQRAANNKLEEAVQAVAQAYPTILNGASLIDFTVIMEGLRYNNDTDESLTQVGLAYRGGECRATIVLGQLALAHDIVMDSFGSGEED